MIFHKSIKMDMYCQRIHQFCEGSTIDRQPSSESVLNKDVPLNVLRKRLLFRWFVYISIYIVCSFFGEILLMDAVQTVELKNWM